MTHNPDCSACVKSEARGIHLIRGDKSNGWYAELLDVSEATIRRHWKHTGEENITMQTPGPNTTNEERFAESFSESSNGSRTFEAVRDRPVTLEDAREWLRASGDDPDLFNISIRSIAYGKDMFSNKMSAWPKSTKALVEEQNSINLIEEIDVVQLLADVRTSIGSDRPEWVAEVEGKESAFVFSINDTQLGKKENGGTAGTLARMYKAVDLAKARINALRMIGYRLEKLIILGGGDIIEGCTIFPHQSFTIDLDRKGQIETAVGLILYVIDELSPYFDEVTVAATRGNHGENRIDGNKTTLHDNDDTLVFEMARLAASRDPQLSHVEFNISTVEAGVYVDVFNWRLATTHGDVFGKGVAGATTERKAHEWLKNMAAGRDPLGLADILVTHHWHHDCSSDWGATVWQQTPALDGGSEYFRQATGKYSEPGVLTFVITPEERLIEKAVLR